MSINQTPNEWVENLSQDLRSQELGTGIFLIKVSEQGTETYKKSAILNVTYQECIDKSVNSLSFKWVPQSVEANIPADIPPYPHYGTGCTNAGDCGSIWCFCYEAPHSYPKYCR
jgi:hypothetical protein